jgi:uncharacterized protein with von Willebrand factor type A (vWA) domain
MKGIFRYGNYGWLGDYRARSIISAVKRQAPQMKIDDPLIPLEIFHSCYLLNTSLSRQDDPLVRLCEPILKDKELRKMTVAEDLISRVFAVKFLLTLQKLQKRQQGQQGQQGQKGQQGDQGQQEFQQFLQQLSAGEGASEEQKKRAQEAKKLIEQAKEEAKKQAQQIKLYAGLKAGVGHRVTFGELLGLEEFVVDLSELLKLFKDISSIDFSKTLKECPLGSREGIKFGKDLSKVIPTALSLPDELFWYKFATGILPVVETKTAELEEFLLLVDKSLSMKERNKTLWSRAVALALAMHAKKGNLKCKLAFFDSDVYPEKPIDLVDDFDKALKVILSLRCEGGTSINTALKFGDRQAKKIILVTDGEDDTVTYKPKCPVVSIMVEGNNDTLRKISEKYLKVRPDRSGALQLFEAIS